MNEAAHSQAAGATTRQRVVLLGASNLTRGFSTVIDTARGLWSGPLEVLAAIGSGRSYGRDSMFMHRELTGIVQCGLWKALDELPPAPTVALITDIGNDLPYEEPVDRIAGWIEECLDRLLARGARTTIMLLPLVSLQALPAWRYLLLRKIFFPDSRLTLADAVERACELNQRIVELAAGHAIVSIEHRGAWYGFDPIHIKLRHWPEAWREILGYWSDDEGVPAATRVSLARTFYFRALMPEKRRIFGVLQRRRQPAAVLSDGTTISLY